MDNSRAMLAALAGACVGGFVAYLFLTPDGRELRRKLEPALDDLTHELHAFRQTVQKAVGIANDGWQLLTDAIEGGAPSRYPNVRQTSPF